MKKHSWKNNSSVVLLVVVGVVCAFGSRAEAREGGSDGFIEVAIGQAVPLGDDQWDDTWDDTLKLGLRGGVGARRGLGFEVALDYTPLDSSSTSVGGLANLETDISRYRLMVGGRGGVPVARNVRAFGRALIGVDYMRGTYEGQILGQPFDGDEDDVGLGLEIGGGVAFNVLDVLSVGVQLNIPIAFHFNEADSEDPIDNEYTAYDVDLMLTVGTSF
jgi:opacity protein-like surface antigen